MNVQLTYQDERKNSNHIQSIKENRHPIIFILDGLTDVRNIGSLFRLADAARLEKIYLYHSNFSEKNRLFPRVSRSTHQYITYQKETTFEELRKLKEKYEFVALEISSQSISYQAFIPKKSIALIIGSEREGVSEELLALCDKTVHIPMYGINTSMNVACASSIVTYDFLGKVLKTQ